jgi:Integrase zinc binding domain
MVQSDALSRREDHVPENDTNNEDAILLSDELFVNFVDASIHDLFAEWIMKEDLVCDVVKALKEKGTPPIKSSLEDWKVENGLLFLKDRCYILANMELQWQMVGKYHNLLPGGHPGQWQTTELLQRDYWWPRMVTFIKGFVKGCATCQQMKINTHPTVPPLSPIKSDVT